MLLRANACMAMLGRPCPVGDETPDRLIEKLVPRIEKS